MPERASRSSVPPLRPAVPQQPRVSEPDRMQRARGEGSRRGCFMTHTHTTRRPLLPVKRILEKTFLPHHRSYCPGHQVRVILGAVAHKVAESQLPGLSEQKHSTGQNDVSVFRHT